MTRKPPTGARHEGCRTHVAHDYVKSGWICSSTYSPADMVAFADHLAAAAMAHRSRELERQAIPALTAADYAQPVDYLPDGRPVARIMPQYASGTVHLPFDRAADREARANLAAEFNARTDRTPPAPDTYAAAVARVKAPAPVKTRKARAVTAPPDVVPDGLTFAEPDAPEPVDWHCAPCDAVYPLPVVSHAVHHVSAPATEPEPVSIAPEPAPPVLAVLPSLTPDGRPICERCGQLFRKHGTGAEWHRVNRPDCAGARPALQSIA